ncbi:hypothetical protein AYO21_06496 [Fonsecaea monophora]|uniref:3-hydroxyisobutyrate dehydrogenase n=1 Tax=Fonsecaea monophora TaxID=254056 RepID=A0A177F786_9EURO|nr:hypothetical protein AYO21_06496 [Fonsecaea monophora]KAH0830968.1 putative 3-hydroxyisobutyrate dehydrogenase, mitochondrial [Fonsecaea pedrosoi]OAG39292.1 hypothetical protein AYO21_06496 [Fonsecaea monophora]
MTGNIGFIGLGAMGYHMAGHLRRKMPSEDTLYVTDVNKAATRRFLEEMGTKHGPVKVVKTAKEAATDAKVVISIVPRAENVKQVYLGPNGVIEAPPDPDRLLLECSTIDTKTTREVEAKLREASIGRYFDAPVSGGVIGAERGTLSFLIGNTPSESDPINQRILGIVSKMGLKERITFCGPIGTGTAAKIANNSIASATILAVSEAMAAGIRAGIDKKILYECIRTSTGQSWVLENNQPCPGLVPHTPSSNGYKVSFLPSMLVKDTTLAVEAALQVGIRPTMVQAALETYKKTAEDPRCKVSGTYPLSPWEFVG